MKWTCMVATNSHVWVKVVNGKSKAMRTLKQMRKDLFQADNDLRFACWPGEARVLVQNDDGSTIHYGKDPKP